MVVFSDQPIFFYIMETHLWNFHHRQKEQKKLWGILKMKKEKILQHILLPGSAGKLVFEEILFFFLFVFKVKLGT